MTVGVAWVRNTDRGEEAWIATDSRLGGDGNVWDCCPKVIATPRRDLIAAFSGDTEQAYPLLIQMMNGIEAHRPAADGAMDLALLVEHLGRVANDMLSRVERDPHTHGEVGRGPFVKRGDAIVLAGYSRRHNALILRALQFDHRSASWKFVKTRSRKRIGGNKLFRIFGDRYAAPRYAYLLEERLRSAGKLRTHRPFDDEPVTALWDFLEMPSSDERPLLRDRRPTTVGGPLQLMQIRSGGSATPIAVRWPSGNDGNVHLMGRPVLLHEHIDAPLLERSGQGLALIGAGRW